jgi:hypothetical protein
LSAVGVDLPKILQMFFSIPGLQPVKVSFLLVGNNLPLVIKFGSLQFFFELSGYLFIGLQLCSLAADVFFYFGKFLLCVSLAVILDH